MKICLVVDNLDICNGGGRFAREFVRSFAGKDIDFDIIALRPLAESINARVTVLRPVWWRIPANALAIRRAAKRCGIIHSFDLYPNAFLVWLGTIGLCKPHVVTLIGTRSVQPLYHHLMAPFIRMVARSARALIAISTYTAEQVNKKVPAVQINIIAPFSFATPSALRPDERFMQKIDAFKPYIISVWSGIKPRKGCIENIQVFARLNKHMPKLRFLIVASPDDSPYSRALLAEIKQLGIEDKVEFVKGLSEAELSYVYTNAKLYLMLSRYNDAIHDIEGFGLVYLEAASHGVLSIGNYDSGARDAIAEGQSGFLVQASNRDELVEQAFEAARAVLQTDGAAQHEGAKMFSRSFTAQKSADAYRVVYQSIVGGNASVAL